MTSMPPAPGFSAAPLPCSTISSVIPNFTIPENNQDLGDEIPSLAGHINAAQYRFLKLLGALVQRSAWGGDSGMKSPAHWLNYYCGITLGAAREKVRVANCLHSLPLIDEAFSTGAISFSKVRAMTRSATPENESYLLGIAKHGTAQHMETLVRKYQRAQRLNQPNQESAQYQAREFSSYYDDDGMLVFSGKLPAEDGAVFLKAMDAVLQSLRDEKLRQEKQDQNQTQEEVEFEEERLHAERVASGLELRTEKHADQPLEKNDYPCHGEAAKDSSDSSALREQKSVSAETFLADLPEQVENEITEQTCTQKRADALVYMAEHVLATLHKADQSLPSQAQSRLTPLSGGDKYQVLIHIDADPHHDGTEPQCHLDNGVFLNPLSAETARRLACDASVVTVMEDSAGNVLNVGRKTRTIPPAIRRALKLRDRGCRFPGCCESRFVDAHHIQHWCDGGATSLDNLLLLCRHHHRLLHQNIFSIEVVSKDAEFVFINSQGKRIEQALFPQFRVSQATRLEAGFASSLVIEQENKVMGLEIDTQTAITAWQGESMDYSLAVAVLMDSNALPTESM